MQLNSGYVNKKLCWKLIVTSARQVNIMVVLVAVVSSGQKLFNL